MSLLKHLQFQKIDDQPDETLKEYSRDDEIKLNESPDEKSLDNYWDSVIEDVHKDKDWFTFSDK